MATGTDKSFKSRTAESTLSAEGTRYHQWRSIILSVVIHSALLVGLALLWTNRMIGGGEEGPRRVEIVLASATEDNEYFDEADLMQAESTASSPSASETIPDEPPPIDVSELVNEVTPIDLPLPGMTSSEMTTPTQSSTLPNAELSEAQKKLLAAESAAFAARQPKGPATSIRVFGSGEMSGRKFVFVLDRSRSMGAQGLNVLSAASKELTTAINSLETYHEFQIVAYHHRTLTITRRSLLHGTDANKKEVAGFIADLAAFGGTEHELALTMALSMNPDVIVFITDGGTPELNQSQLTRIHRTAGGAQIHCVQFGLGPQRQTNNFMRKLAGDNLGTYRYIDVTEWNH